MRERERERDTCCCCLLLLFAGFSALLQINKNKSFFDLKIKKYIYLLFILFVTDRMNTL
jgi:hypothetical protein